MESAHVRHLRTSCWCIRNRAQQTNEHGERVRFLIQKQRVRKYRSKHFPCGILFIIYILRYASICQPFISDLSKLNTSRSLFFPSAVVVVVFFGTLQFPSLIVKYTKPSTPISEMFFALKTLYCIVSALKASCKIEHRRPRHSMCHWMNILIFTWPN